MMNDRDWPDRLNSELIDMIYFLQKMPMATMVKRIMMMIKWRRNTYETYNLRTAAYSATFYWTMAQLESRARQETHDEICAMIDALPSSQETPETPEGTTMLSRITNALGRLARRIHWYSPGLDR